MQPRVVVRFDRPQRHGVQSTQHRMFRRHGRPGRQVIVAGRDAVVVEGDGRSPPRALPDRSSAELAAAADGPPDLLHQPYGGSDSSSFSRSARGDSDAATCPRSAKNS